MYVNEWYMYVQCKSICNFCSPYVTRSEDHDHHMTVFPSMRPAGRHEVVTLKVRPAPPSHDHNSIIVAHTGDHAQEGWSPE